MENFTEEESDSAAFREIEEKLEILINEGKTIDYEEEMKLKELQVIELRGDLEDISMEAIHHAYIQNDVRYLKAYGKERYIARCRIALDAAERCLQELENE